MKANTITIDLAKNVFQLLGVDSSGNKLFSKRLNRAKMIEFMRLQPAAFVVIEACFSSHYWGRLFNEMGHQTAIIPAQHVKPFVRGNKNDKNDCLAIYEASRRPNIRFVPIKSEAQQEVLALHRMRERFIGCRTQCINQTRSILSEFGVTIPQSHAQFKIALVDYMGDNTIRPSVRLLLNTVYDELEQLNQHLALIDSLIRQYNQQSPAAKLMQSLPGVGPIIASAFSAAIDKGQAFQNAKELPVWLGLTPKQHASGETNQLGSITKRGDRYLRKQLIHGARTVVSHAHKKNDDFSRWINRLVERRGKNKAVVATAHRLARLMWILLAKGEAYQPQYTASA
ncbi:IS110 family transposase [Ferrimonas kyonanensis]|uniref:IS110 family transposase n=1 Tax=Ferrimonas kyonanensis TaxID=364763 RepID=UPI000405FF19|nr:IS110 family transposase [Ferrimonas kyonanensis]